MQRFILLILALAGFASVSIAQEVPTPTSTSTTPTPEAKGQSYPKYEIFGGYLSAAEPQYNVFHFGSNITAESGFGSKAGIEASVIRNFKRYLGIKLDFSSQMHHENGTAIVAPPCGTPPCPTTAQPFDLAPKLFNFLAGPEFKARNHTRYTPFAHALFGIAHTTATFKTSGSALNLSPTTTETGFGMAFGGGVDVQIDHRISLRAAVDYNPKLVGRGDAGERARIDDLRITTGILFHF